MALGLGKRRAQEVNTQNLRAHWIRKEGPHDYVILWESTEVWVNPGLPTVSVKEIEAILFKF